jgi:hypothetical protein
MISSAAPLRAKRLRVSVTSHFYLPSADFE